VFDFEEQVFQRIDPTVPIERIAICPTAEDDSVKSRSVY
jgi:hypothetical protein